MRRYTEYQQTNLEFAKGWALDGLIGFAVAVLFGFIGVLLLPILQGAPLVFSAALLCFIEVASITGGILCITEAIACWGRSR